MPSRVESRGVTDVFREWVEPLLPQRVRPPDKQTQGAGEAAQQAQVR